MSTPLQIVRSLVQSILEDEDSSSYHSNRETYHNILQSLGYTKSLPSGSSLYGTTYSRSTPAGTHTVHLTHSNPHQVTSWSHSSPTQSVGGARMGSIEGEGTTEGDDVQELQQHLRQVHSQVSL